MGAAFPSNASFSRVAQGVQSSAVVTIVTHGSTARNRALSATVVNSHPSSRLSRCRICRQESRWRNPLRLMCAPWQSRFGRAHCFLLRTVAHVWDTCCANRNGLLLGVSVVAEVMLRRHPIAATACCIQHSFLAGHHELGTRMSEMGFAPCPHAPEILRGAACHRSVVCWTLPEMGR
jgi:hypothetical protein